MFFQNVEPLFLCLRLFGFCFCTSADRPQAVSFRGPLGERRGGRHPLARLPPPTRRLGLSRVKRVREGVLSAIHRESTRVKRATPRRFADFAHSEHCTLIFRISRGVAVRGATPARTKNPQNTYPPVSTVPDSTSPMAWCSSFASNAEGGAAIWRRTRAKNDRRAQDEFPRSTVPD